MAHVVLASSSIRTGRPCTASLTPGETLICMLCGSDYMIQSCTRHFITSSGWFNIITYQNHTISTTPLENRSTKLICDLTLSDHCSHKPKSEGQIYINVSSLYPRQAACIPQPHLTLLHVGVLISHTMLVNLRRSYMHHSSLNVLKTT